MPLESVTSGLGAGRVLLDRRGFHRAGDLVCSWPGGSFDLDHEPLGGMILGYDATFETYSPCDAWPFVSTWGSRGVGPAVLYIAFWRITDGVAFVPTQDGEAPLRLPPGWIWYSEPRLREPVSRIVRRTAGLGEFLRAFRVCLAQGGDAICIADYVAPGLVADRPDLLSCASATHGVQSEGSSVTLRPGWAQEEYGTSCLVTRTSGRWQISGIDRGC